MTRCAFSAFALTVLVLVLPSASLAQDQPAATAQVQPAAIQQSSNEERMATAVGWLKYLQIASADQLLAPDRNVRETLITSLRTWAAGPLINVPPPAVEKIGDDGDEVHHELADMDAPAPSVPWVGGLEFHRLTIPLSERFQRFASVKIEGIQTPKYIYGVPFNAPADTAKDFLLNPDSKLFNYSATFNLAELFLSVSDRTAACQAALDLRAAGIAIYDRKHMYDRSCGKGAYQFVTGDRNRDVGQRFLSAISVTYTAAQNAKSQSSLVSYDTPITFSHTVSGSFDPSKFWRSASDWSSAIAVLPPDPSQIRTSGEADSKELRSTGSYPCLSLNSFNGCFYRYAYGWRKTWLFQALIPTVTVKVNTPLNFQSNGNIFATIPLDERKTLYDVTFSLDLTRFVPNNATRSKAAAVMIALAKVKTKAMTPPASPTDDRSWKNSVSLLYIALLEDPRLSMNEEWWRKFESLVTRPQQ